MTDKILFKPLYERALKDLPEEIDFQGLISYTEDKTRYEVAGLKNINGSDYDEFANQYIGAVDEVLMRNMHDAICAALHAVAKFCTSIKLSNLREESVKEYFDNNLKIAMSRETLGWGESDKQLIDKYFKDTGNVLSPQKQR